MGFGGKIAGKVAGKVAGKAASAVANRVISAVTDKAMSAIASNPDLVSKLGPVGDVLSGIQGSGGDISSLMPDISSGIQADPNLAGGLVNQLKGSAEGLAKDLQGKAESLTSE